MCILFLAYRVYGSRPFLLLDNRDEYYERETEPLHQWDDFPSIVGSRDLERGGTWMAVNHELKRFAVLTNLRESHELVEQSKQLKSRGKAVLDILIDPEPLETAVITLSNNRSDFAGFNLIIGDLTHFEKKQEKIWYFGSYLSDNNQALQLLQPGKTYGLSNASLNTPWPKLTLGVQLVTELGEGKAAQLEVLYEILLNSDPVSKDELVSTGLETMEHEYRVSSIFVDHHEVAYGTRTSSILMIKKDDPTLHYHERTFISPPRKDLFKDAYRAIPLLPC